MFGQSSSCTPKSSFCKLLYNERYEGDEKHYENGDNAAPHPIEDGDKVGASCWVQRIGDRFVPVVPANDGFMAESSNIDQTDHEQLKR